VIDVTLKVRDVQEKIIIYDFQIMRQSDGKLAAEGFVKCIAINSEWKTVSLPGEVSKTIRNSIVQTVDRG
jgi:acyl-CoA thioesterase FadM